jgi:WD40 repeat protein
LAQLSPAPPILRYVVGVAFSPDGNRLASPGAEGVVNVWDATTGQLARTLKGQTLPFYGVAWSPDGKRLAGACGGYDKEKKDLVGEVIVWDAQTGQEALTLHRHTGEVYHVAFSPDGSRLATSAKDGTVKVWDATTGQEKLSIKPAGAVSWSSDSTRLVENWTGVKIRDARTGQVMLSLQGPARCVTFSPDGCRLASASSDAVLVWPSRPLAPLPAPQPP